MFTALLLTVLGADLHGQVVSVHDGDTLTLLVDSRQVKIRLASIDAPERGQPFGNAAKSALSDLVFGKDVRIETAGRDRYGRILGTIYVGEVQVNQRLIDLGLCWHFRRYSQDYFYTQSELDARVSGVGLWSDPNPVEPWVWRGKK